MDGIEVVKRFYICRKKDGVEQRVMGNGIVQLLQAIKANGSINLACKNTGLSYSKALRIIQNCERELGKNVIIHKKGGFERAGAILTEDGERLIEIWEEFMRDCDLLLSSRVDELLRRIYG